MLIDKQVTNALLGLIDLLQGDGSSLMDEPENSEDVGEGYIIIDTMPIPVL